MSTLEDLAADIADMEALLARAERPKVRAIICDHLDHLRKEQALRTHSAQFTGVPAANPVSAPKSSTASTSVPAIRSPAPAPAPPRAPASAPPRAPAPAPPPAPPPVRLPTTSGGGGAVVTYTTISSFGWDQDSYGKEPNFIYVYITSGVDGVGDVKDSVVCDFNKSSFDLKIIGLGGKNFRLYKNQLDKEIVPTESKVVVKKNRLTIKMKKVKGQFGYDQWVDLTAKRPKLDKETGKEADPGASLMDMMKDLYDNGDDQMKKTLGEAMIKSRQQQEAGGVDSPSFGS